MSYHKTGNFFFIEEILLKKNKLSAVESEFMENLERNKRFYDRNSMVIFGHLNNEENLSVGTNFLI